MELGVATETYAAFGIGSRTSIHSSGATLQEIRRHEGWGYGALDRAQNGDK